MEKVNKSIFKTTQARPREPDMGTFKEDCSNKCPLEALGQEVFRIECKNGV